MSNTMAMRPYDQQVDWAETAELLAKQLQEALRTIEMQRTISYQASEISRLLGLQADSMIPKGIPSTAMRYGV